MNTSYRLIWDDLREMLVIVDENGRARSRKGGRRVRRAVLPVALFTAVLGGAVVAPWGGEAWAVVCAAGTAHKNSSVACGVGATTGDMQDSIAIGLKSDASANNQTIALGAGSDITNGAKAEGYASIAIGSWSFSGNAAHNAAQAQGLSSVAIGTGSSTGSAASNSVALGADSVANAADVVSVGNANLQRRIINVAAGTNDTDAVNKKQLDDGLAAKADATDLANKADINLGNINDEGKGVITGLIDVKGTGAADVSLNTDNGKKTWTVHVAKDGKVVAGNDILVTGDTMFTELRPANGNYVQQGNTTAANLTALDTQVKNNEDGIAQNTAKINEGLHFTGNTGTQVDLPLTSTLAIVGDGNITTEANGADTITIRTVDSPTFSGTVTAGAVNTGAINADAVTVGTGANPVRIDGTTHTITGLANTAPVTRTNYTPGRAATEDQLAQHHFNISDGTNTSGVYGGDTVRFRGDRNIHVTVDGLDINITLDPDLNVRSVTTGRARMDDSGFHIANGPSVTVNGIDAAGTRVTNVADGVLPYDAVNKGQLDAVDQRLSNRIGRVEDKSYAGISSALAAAALPRSGVPGDLTLGAGVSSYEGASALAVGGAYTTPGGIIFTLAGTVNSEEASASAGVGFRFNLGN